MYIKIPLQNEATEKIFRWSYARDLLMLLAKDPLEYFTVSDIINRLDIRSRDSLTKLLEAMEDADIIKSTRMGRKRFISINRELVEIPKEPIFQIPQKEYQNVVKKILERIVKLSDVEKVILFGAVARGTADRMSDLDILVIGKNVTKLQEKTSKVAYDCRTGKMFEERFEVNIRVISIEEVKRSRGFIKDALNEGIKLYGD